MIRPGVCSHHLGTKRKSLPWVGQQAGDGNLEKYQAKRWTGMVSLSSSIQPVMKTNRVNQLFIAVTQVPEVTTLRWKSIFWLMFSWLAGSMALALR